MPLPAAMNRLAAQAGLGLAASDEALIREYGEKPGRAGVHALADEIGAGLSIARIDVARLGADDLPLIAIRRGGSAVIVRGMTRDGFAVEGARETRTMARAALVAALTGAVVRLDLREAAATKAVSSPAVSGAAPKPDALGPNVALWLASLVWRRHRPAFFSLLTASAIGNLFLIALPLFIMSVYDRVIPHAAYESLITLTVGILIVFAADLALRFARLKFVDAIGLSIARDLQLRLYRRLLNTQLARRPKSASVITSLQGEIETLCLLTPEFMAIALTDTLFAAAVLALIASIGGLVVLAPIIGVGIVASVVYAGASLTRRDAKLAIAMRGAGVAQIAETYDSLVGVKSVGAETTLLKQFERLVEATAAKGHQARQRGRFAGQAAGVVVQATIVGTLFFGVMRIDAGLMSIGSLAATTILVGRAITPVAQIVDQYCRIATLKDVLDAAMSLLSEGEETGGETDGGRRRQFQGVVSLRNVSFAHEDGGIKALDGVDLSIRPGERIAVVGKNGGGKSTLLQLLPRLLTPTTGAMLIDGYDARQFSPRRLRQEIGFMPQETVLFNDSLRANICLGPDDFSEEDFERAVRAAGVDRFAMRHPNGYSLQVGPRGEFLSAGERQAVGLARTLLRQRRIYVLDEPTSLMDHTLEGHVITALREIIKDRTLIVSTHRLRLLELVDRVIALESGRVIADGPRDVVLKSLSAAGAQRNPDASPLARSA